MALADQELKEHLMATNDDFRRLAAEHQAYKKQLSDLASKPHLSAQEQLDEIQIKKRKLHLKDQMEAMLQQYKKQAMSA